MPGGNPNAGWQYELNSPAEDVSQIIYQITPEDRPFMTMIGMADPALQSLHQWQVRSLTTRQHNAQPEGFTYDFTAAMTLPTRKINFCQIFAKEIRVSNTEVASSHYAIGDLFADQMEIRLAEITMGADRLIKQLESLNQVPVWRPKKNK